MTAWTPTPAQYAAEAAVKSPLWQRVDNPAADDQLRQFCQDATTQICAETGRVWCLPTPLVATTVVLDAPYSRVLSIPDLTETTGLVVTVGGVALVADAYTVLWRTIAGQARHAYALVRTTGTWADGVLDAPQGAITLTSAYQATTATPPGPIVQAVVRVAAAFYTQWVARYQRQTGGSDELGTTPIPNAVVTADTQTVTGPWIHPRRPLGRP